MINLYRFGSFLLGLLLSAFVCAADLKVEDVWARATLPGQDVGMVNLTITSKQPATLIGISSATCKLVEMHSMTHDDGMMKMREVKSIKLPAGKRVDFEEEGYHLMLIGLKNALTEGESVPLILRVKDKNQRVVNINTSAAVKSITATQATDDEKEHSYHH